MYGAYSLGGFALLSIVDRGVRRGGVLRSPLRPRARSGAGPRAIWVMFLPVLVAAPWAWSIRAQMLALPLYTGLLWLLASEARRPTQARLARAPDPRRLGERPRQRRARSAARDAARRLRAHPEPRAHRGAEASRSSSSHRSPSLATPYGPVDDGALLPPPARRPAVRRSGDRVALGGAGRRTRCSSTSSPRSRSSLVLARPPTPHGSSTSLSSRSRSSGGVSAIRGIVWFALACMVFVPVAIGQQAREPEPAESRDAGSTSRSPSALTAALVAVAGSLFAPRRARGSRTYWPREAVEAVRGELEPDDRVFAPDRFSDWMLFKIPELRGRVAYDVRFELYDKAFFDRLQDYDARTAPTGSRSPTATASSSSTRRVSSHTADFLAGAGRARRSTATTRSRSSRGRGRSHR